MTPCDVAEAVCSDHVTLHPGSVTILQERCCVCRSGDSSARIVDALEQGWNAADTFRLRGFEASRLQDAFDGSFCVSVIALIRVRLVLIVEAFRTSR